MIKVIKCNVKEMCLEAVYRTGTSLCRSEGLWETVPDRLTGNGKGSVSELGSCEWNNEVENGKSTIRFTINVTSAPTTQRL